MLFVFGKKQKKKSKKPGKTSTKKIEKIDKEKETAPRIKKANPADIEAYLVGNVLTSNSKKAYTYTKTSYFGEHVEDKIKYTLSEGLFLVQNGKMIIYQNNKPLTQEQIMEKFTKIDKKFPTKYAVFKDLRVKGYIVKTALKFGAEFRVYEKGKVPGKSHSKWVVFTDNENNKTTWHDFVAKNRVAHSTNKNVLLAIVDEEEQITYYEIKWTRP